MENELKDVIGYEDYFAVTEYGKVWSKRTKKFLKTTLSKKGKYVVFVTRFGGRNGKTKLFRVHRLVAECYVANPENKPFVNHIDGNKQNNHYSNLEWCTSKENSAHAYATGLNSGVKGEENSVAKITDEDARKILELYIPKIFGYRKIARLLNLPLNSVKNVTCPSTTAWKHIEN